MTNDNQSSSPDAGQPEEGKSPGRTLDMQNISISTMKEDLAKDSPAEEKKGGWFDFMAKRKQSPPSSDPSDGSPAGKQSAVSSPDSIPEPAPEEQAPLDKESPVNNSLDKELEEFKTLNQSVLGATENEQLAEKPLVESEKPEMTAAGIGETTIQPDEVEAPANLPISGEPTVGDTEGKLVGKISGTREPAPLESMAEEPGEEDSGISIPDIQGKLKEALGGEIKEETETVNKIKPVDESGIAGSIVRPASQESIGEKIVEDLKGEPAPENPFSSRIQPKEPEKKSLLSSVEAALNYSAPPEFSQEREVQGKPSAGEGPIVDLRKKAAAGPLAGIMANKKLLMIGGGVIGLVLVVGITLMFVLGGKSKTETPKTPVATAPSGNQNQNQNPVTPIKTVTQTPSTVSAKKVLNNALEIPFTSENDISDELEKYRQNKSVAKQSQLVFMKSDGGGATFQDLMNATGILIPRNILAQPSGEAALIFVDFFHGNIIFGLIIPVKDTQEIVMSKLQDWESTMVIDLGDLWKGMNIDNKGAYFADSQIFTGGRFALIDKKQGLSLDYLFQEGYILIAPGKDSMTILKNQFNPPAGGSSSSSIKWEEENSTTVSGVNSNSNTASGASENVNSQ